MTDGPAPDDLAGVYSVPIGDSGAARYAEWASHAASEIDRVLNRYLSIDKLARPWTRDW